MLTDALDFGMGFLTTYRALVFSKSQIPLRYLVRTIFEPASVMEFGFNDTRNSKMHRFLANVNSRSRSLYAIARPSVVCLSVVCNVRTPYPDGSNFLQYFYGIRYPGHPLTSTENFTEIVLGKPLRRGS